MCRNCTRRPATEGIPRCGGQQGFPNPFEIAVQRHPHRLRAMLETRIQERRREGAELGAPRKETAKRRRIRSVVFRQGPMRVEFEAPAGFLVRRRYTQPSPRCAAEPDERFVPWHLRSLKFRRA